MINNGMLDSLSNYPIVNSRLAIAYNKILKAGPANFSLGLISICLYLGFPTSNH